MRLEKNRGDVILPFCMNLLLLGHIFQQKFPERTVQSGERGKKKSEVTVTVTLNQETLSEQVIAEKTLSTADKLQVGRREKYTHFQLFKKKSA